MVWSCLPEYLGAMLLLDHALHFPHVSWGLQESGGFPAITTGISGCACRIGGNPSRSCNVLHPS